MDKTIINCGNMVIYTNFEYDDNSKEEIVKENVGVIPLGKVEELIKFLQEDVKYLLIDYEAPDKVIGVNNVDYVMNYIKDEYIL